MNLRSLTFILLFLSLPALSGCISPPGVSGTLGYSRERRVVIVGERVPTDIALYYQRRYNAMVWFTPPQGRLKDWAHRTLQLGPSQAMRSLINELESTDYTMGRWEIIVPGMAEKYVLATLKHMKTGSLSHAWGDFVLIDSKGNKAIEAQVQRVTGGSFFVSYEFQKYRY
ncbi:MAG: hypothetical protein KGJ95_05625 [Candidatus Omnitrophica bacterium]|nr:hypothetical protein [Candidatus Omnitrophota bacterium]